MAGFSFESNQINLDLLSSTKKFLQIEISCKNPVLQESIKSHTDITGRLFSCCIIYYGRLLYGSIGMYFGNR